MWEVWYDIENKTGEIFEGNCGFEDEEITYLIYKYTHNWELEPKQRDIIDYLSACYDYVAYRKKIIENEKTNVKIDAVKKRKKRAEKRLYVRYAQTVKTMLRMRDGKIKIEDIPEEKRDPIKRLYIDFCKAIKRNNDRRKEASLADGR